MRQLLSLSFLFILTQSLLAGQKAQSFHNVVKEFGCIGDGLLVAGIWHGTNNDECFRRALEATRVEHGALFFPSGIYLYETQPLLIKGDGSVFSSTVLIGENTATTAVVHRGDHAVVATVDFEPSRPDTAFFHPGIRDMTIIGGAHDSYVVKDNAGAHISLRDVRAAGSSEACFYMYEAVAGYMEDVACDEFTADDFGGKTFVGMPRNGIVLAGRESPGSEYYSTPFQILSPKIEGVSGIGLDIEQGAQVVASACQISGNGQSLRISDRSYANTITSCLFENEERASYVGGYNSEISSSIFSNMNHAPTGIIVNGVGNILRGIVVGAGPIRILASASHTVLSSCTVNERKIDFAGSSMGVDDLGAGTVIDSLHYANGLTGGGYSQNEASAAVGSNEGNPAANTLHTASSVWLAGTPGAVTPIFSARFDPKASWVMFACGKFGARGISWNVEGPHCIELSKLHNEFTDERGIRHIFIINTNGFFGYYSSGAQNSARFDGVVTFIPGVDDVHSGSIAEMWRDYLQFPGLLGPERASQGSCPREGVWEFSKDGHVSFCSGGQWKLKL